MEPKSYAKLGVPITILADGQVQPAWWQRALSVATDHAEERLQLGHKPVVQLRTGSTLEELCCPVDGYHCFANLSVPGGMCGASRRESNAENLLIIRAADLAAKYANNWQEHPEHSMPYERKAKE